MGLAAASLLAALLLPAQQRPPYEGHYVTGLETSALTPCDSAYRGERWWVTKVLAVRPPDSVPCLPEPR